MSESLVARSVHEDTKLGRLELDFYVDREALTASVCTDYDESRIDHEDFDLFNQITVTYTRAQLEERIRMLQELAIRLDAHEKTASLGR